MGGIWCGIFATQRASQGEPACCHRHERRLHKVRQRSLRERSGGVGQIPCHPEYGGGVLRGSQSRESIRCWDAGVFEADAVDVAQEPGELDRKRSLEVGVDGSGTMCDRHRLRDEAGASRHLPMKGRGGCQENIRELVRLGEGDAGKTWGPAWADDPRCSDELGAPRGKLGPLDPRPNDQLHGRTQQPVLSGEAQG